MKHLTDEERLGLIEGRANAEAAAHAKECADCAAEITAMRQSIHQLKHFSWPAPMRRQSKIAQPFFRWAAAAALVLCAGIAIGRATAPDAAQIKADVAREVREALRQEALAQVKMDSQKPSPELLGLLTQIREQQTANYLSLRNDLETLAANADSRLQMTRRQIVELAAKTP
jgi:hypothetical protein